MKTILFCCTLFIIACKDDDQSVEPEQPTELQNAVVALTDAADLDTLLKEIGDSRFVLLGEASHGTSEFYEWRAEISRQLITEKGFNVIAVEGDWPDLYRFNSYINGSDAHGSSAEDVLAQMDRWPTWMWANEEVASFGEWLRANNESSMARSVSFYGIDVYSLWDSMEEVLDYLEEVDPPSAEDARTAIKCFGTFNGGDEFAYAQEKTSGSIDCADELEVLLATVQDIAGARGDDAALNALQNADIALNAEKYYVTALRNSSESWNIRDRHMMETVNRITEHHGDNSKVIIWAHNTHVGDARATDMARDGMVNIGQLIREQHAESGVHITGFGTYSGSVVASDAWGAEAESMRVPDAQPNSWESMLHGASPGDKIVFLTALKDNEQYNASIGHRAIGVVYDPENERGNYVPSVLPDRYDTFIFIDETEALSPLLNTTGRVMPITGAIRPRFVIGRLATWY